MFLMATPTESPTVICFCLGAQHALTYFLCFFLFVGVQKQFHQGCAALLSSGTANEHLIAWMLHRMLIALSAL
jgi:hypothetical protein